MLRLYNLVVDLGDVALAVSILVLLPLALFRSKRRFAGVGLMWASAIFGLNLWAYDLAMLWKYWGLVAVIIGVLFTPVVASPVAAIIVALHKNWWALFCIVSYIAMVASAYFGGEKMIESSEADS